MSGLVYRELDEAGHAARVTTLALRIADALGAGRSRIDAIRMGGPLHDIGKAAVPPSILRKPGPLDPDEVKEIRVHPVAGARMLAGVTSVKHALGCVLHHHERWDGHGYPHGLVGHEIPYEARIIAVADAYDAMTTDRPYRAAMTDEDARAEIERCSGTQFDPQVAQAFLGLADATASTRPRASSASA